jgi:outer membrane lipoprotein-sorting protein
MMKKTLSILFLCLAISSFSGCGGSGNTTASQQKESKLGTKSTFSKNRKQRQYSSNKKRYGY